MADGERFPCLACKTLVRPMQSAFLISLLLGIVPFAHARFVREPTIAELFEMAPLAVTGEVTSITPLGIDTTLSYPKDRQYDFSGVVDNDYMKKCMEKKEFVWSLV